MSRSRYKTPGMALVHAASRGDVGELRLLLAEHPDRLGARQLTLAFLAAAGHGQVTAAAHLLDHGADPLVHRREVIQAAASRSDAELLRMLVERGAAGAALTDPETLRLAARAGCVESIRLIVAAGARPDARQSLALRAAAGEGHAEAVAALVELGANPRALADETLRFAAKEEGGEFLSTLLALGRFPAATQRQALDWALAAHQAENAYLLLQSSELVNDPIPDDAAYVAARAGSAAMLRLVAERGGLRGERGGAALVLAASARDAVAVAMLLEAGVDPRAAESEPLLRAIAIGDAAIAALLLDAGARADARDDQPIIDAARRGDASILALLIRHGANPRARDEEPIVLAAQTGVVDASRALLAAGASATARDDEPLAAAIRSGRADAVALLLERGARASARDGALLIEAARLEHADVLRAMLRAGAGPRGGGSPPAAMLGRAFLAAAVAERAEALAALYETFRIGRGDIAEALLAASRAGKARSIGWILERAGLLRSTALNDALAAGVDAGHAEAVRVLVAAGARPRSLPDEARRRAEALLERGAD